MENRRKHNTAISRAAAVLQLGLVGLIVYLIVRTVIAIVTPESLWTLPTQNTPASAVQASKTAQSYDFAFDPFQRGQAPAPVDIGKDAPETTLNLKLFGLRSGDKGSAILQTPDNKQGVYSIGDEVINGVTIKSINPDYIVLSINGRLERLTFARGQESALRTTPETAPRTRASAESFFRQVDIKPVILDAGQRGFRVTPRFGGAKLSQFGLQSGDILLSLGGTDLTRGQPNLAAISQAISRTSEVDVRINRGGEILNLKVKM